MSSMRFFYHPLVLFGLLSLIVTTSFAESRTSFYFTTSEISLRPGDTTKFFVAAVLLLATLGYWLLSKKEFKSNWKVVLPHLLLSIPTVVFIRFWYLWLNDGLHELSRHQLGILQGLIFLAYGLF